MPLRRKGIHVCIYNPAMCGLVRVKGTHPVVVFSAMHQCVRCGKCRMGCISGFASMSSGVVGGTVRRNMDTRRVSRHCVTRYGGSVSNVGMGPTAAGPRTARRVSKVVDVVRALISGKCTCPTTSNAICFEIGGFGRCNGLSRGGLSSLRSNFHSLRMSNRSRGRSPLSFIL